MMRKAFTLMELVVALAILAVVLSFAGVIFRVSIDSHRMALANAEIMQKLRVITDQLDADFRSLCKDGEIFVVWDAKRKPDYAPVDANGNPINPTINRNDSLGFERFDRIMFFTTGDFQAYGRPERGNVARICYSLARGPSDIPGDVNLASMQKPSKRILARTQHILIPPGSGEKLLDTNDFTTEQWLKWNSQDVIDRISLEGWKRIPWRQKIDMLSVIGDIVIKADVDGKVVTSDPNQAARAVLIDPA
ncbi:MAG: prepilin-type N-terminal cleavage/methylation domain-containing protein, partial [Phycisphaerales bacterium]